MKPLAICSADPLPASASQYSLHPNAALELGSCTDRFLPDRLLLQADWQSHASVPVRNIHVVHDLCFLLSVLEFPVPVPVHRFLSREIDAAKKAALEYDFL